MNSNPQGNTATPSTPATSASSANLVDAAAANGSFGTFGKVLRQAGMEDTLRGEGPFTLFAPTDAAFDNLPAGKLDSLMKPENKAELVSVLNYHVLSGRKSAAEIGKWQSAKTVNGQFAPIKLMGEKVSIDGAELTGPDISASNGIIHAIDKVNIPTKQ